MSSTSTKVAKIEEILGYTFQDKSLIQAALTHPSATEGMPISACYERLEFLGDSILGAIVASDMFEKFPQMDEGELTRLKISLVSGETLSMVAEELGMAPCIIFGDAERGTGKRGLHSALENVYESCIGALYLEAGISFVHAFVQKTLGPHMTPERAQKPISPKSRLQELTQRDLRCAPEYRLEKEEGPAHDPTFTSVVYVEGKRVGRGVGSSKKQAETNAALQAIDLLSEQKRIHP